MTRFSVQGSTCSIILSGLLYTSDCQSEHTTQFYNLFFKNVSIYKRNPTHKQKFLTYNIEVELFHVSNSHYSKVFLNQKPKTVYRGLVQTYQGASSRAHT